MNGSDLLLKVDGKAYGHCTTTGVSISTETKDRTVKPLDSIQELTASLFADKGVTRINVSITAEGLINYDEEEQSYKGLMDLLVTGQTVDVEVYERGISKKAFSGKFAITSLELTAPANDDVTYSITLENSGVVTFDPDGLTVNAAGQ